MDSNPVTVKDNLKFINDPEIKNIIGDEQILFSGKIIKINRYGFNQERNIQIIYQN